MKDSPSPLRVLSILFHSKTGNTRRLAEAARDGARDPGLDPVEVVFKPVRDAGPEDLLAAQGLMLATPENFGYMSGALKDFFDRTFYEVEGRLAPLPYCVLVSAGNDGTGAVRAVERIANGYPLVRVQPPLICRGSVTAEHIAQSRERGMTMAAALALGMF